MELIFRAAMAAPASALLLATVCVISVLALTRAPQLIERNILRPYWLVRRHEYATLATSGFVHADFVHLAFNAFTFVAFGFGLERAIGTPRFVVLYVFGLLVSCPANTWHFDSTRW